ncbi:MAG: Na(+)-translocating NADH-quinone reductase subunit A [Dysgonamonadaceae bacterium]|jgi:Na+-transporting NADH:ubiquinone oxidoreductase subunit A|nr:Na(+)-translocating NADH-quinone reductase subunit A [Dysgonamonadaceae bacterium]
MDQVIKIKKGLNIDLTGKPQEITKHAVLSQFYTVYPGDFHGFTPKVAVKQGDTVLAGTPVMYDKNRPEIKITAPVSGTIAAVVRGEKRRLQSIVIQAENKNNYLNFGKKEVKSLSPETIKSALAESGIMALIRQRPYDIIADPQNTPRDIFVPGFYSTPLAPNLEYIIKGCEEDFQIGLDALAAVTSGNVYLGIRPDCKANALKNAKNVTIAVFDGPHPAGNAGVQINHIKPVNKGETVWTIHPHNVLIIGRFFNKGIVDMTRLVAFAGSEVNESDRAYYPMIMGASIEKLVKSSVTEHIDLRYISGNVLTGTQIASDGSLHACDNQITVIPEGSETHDFLGWIKPNLKGDKDVMDARIKGGRRTMIMSNEWDKVFPMDIMPEFLIRAILANDPDKMENLGIYEVAPEDFALCEFVDASKMELQKIVRQGLDLLYKEMN